MTTNPPRPSTYLAKDYASLLQLVRDRLDVTLPGWTEQHAPDFMVALTELMAYVADRLSYHQDAVATEAYLRTARLRTSVRRHTRLLDYPMHEGCNARTVVCIEVNQDVEVDLDKIYFATSADLATRAGKLVDEAAVTSLGAAVLQVFEPVGTGPRLLRKGASRMDIAAPDRVLRRGATSARLLTFDPDAVTVGDIVVFEPADRAQVDLRHAVRVQACEHAKGGIAVRWDPVDALPFDLPVTTTDTAHASTPVAFAFGNALLVDHGKSSSSNVAGSDPSSWSLRGAPLTWAQPVDPLAAATELLDQDARRAEPALGPLTMTENLRDTFWQWRPSLIHSRPDDRHFTLEVDNSSVAHVRFGDGQLGCVPPVRATGHIQHYRVGNGSAGNIDPDVLSMVVPNVKIFGTDTEKVVIHNAFAARGTDPEPEATVRIVAPRHPGTDRAVVATDYADRAASLPGVAGAHATTRWHEMCYRVEVSIDPVGRTDPRLPERLRLAVERDLEQRRMVGHRVVVLAPRYVAVSLKLWYRLDPEAEHRERSVAELRVALGDGHRVDGVPALFHPSRFGFGDPVAASRILAAALQVPDVLDARVLSLQAPKHAIDQESGVLMVRPDELVRLSGPWKGDAPGITLTTVPT